MLFYEKKEFDKFYQTPNSTNLKYHFHYLLIINKQGFEGNFYFDLSQ